MNLWCLHGAVGMAADWEYFAERMAVSGHEVKALDLWSYQEGAECSFQEFARKVCEEARGEEHPPVLVGYSMGGRLALHALLEDSEAWSGAMIVSAHPGLQDEGERILRMAADAEWAGKALTAPWVEFLEQWESQSVLQGTCMVSPADRRHLESRREAVARGFTSWSLGKQADLRSSLQEVAQPVVWVSGVRDHKFTVLAEELWAGMPNAFHLGPVEAGHRVPWEAPDDFAHCVEHLLDIANRWLQSAGAGA